MAEKLSNTPYKGTQDYFPVDYEKLSYIFSKWRSVCVKYGYQEYLTPTLEPAEIYEAKSGEDVKRELFTLTDHGGRRLSLRPEMTPSVTRMITRIYNKEIKPLRYFSIANFFRGERPQKGRGREFWQLNVDIFGEKSILADFEVLSMALDIMLSFNAPKNSFILKLNNRKLINYLFDSVLKITDTALKIEITRKMDKFEKVSREEFEEMLRELGLSQDQIRAIAVWMTFSFDQLDIEFPGIIENEGYQETKFLIDLMAKTGKGDFITYAANLIRGFDYYDGSIFEIFDMNPSLKKALFGGGRYNGLAGLFGSQEIPAVGFAPGDMPISEFLTNWDLWPDFSNSIETYFIPVLSNNAIESVYSIATRLRLEGKSVEIGSNVELINKALSYANKKGFEKVVIIGEDELRAHGYKVKDMKSGEETLYEDDRN